MLWGADRGGVAHRSRPYRILEAHIAPELLPLWLPHTAELLPAGPKQRRHLPSPGNGLGGVVPVLPRVAVARRRADAVSPAVHPAPDRIQDHVKSRRP